MKTKHILIAALMLTSIAVITAQSEKKSTTVRIKKVENINGVEKVTDTTYTTNNPSDIMLDDGNASIQEIKDKDGKIKKMVIINTGSDSPKISFDKDGSAISVHSDKDVNGNAIDKKISLDNDQGNSKETMVINIGKPMSPEEEAAFEKEMKKVMDENASSTNRSGQNIIPGGTKEDEMAGKQIMIKKLPCGSNKEDIEKGPVAFYIIVHKKVEIKDANEDDLKLIGKQSGTIDNKLPVDKLNFYPNPNNGKFNLNFSLSAKGTTEVSIVNTEGKSVYNEELKDFSGKYDKEIDISNNPKGVYYVKIKQGTHAQLKKIVME